MAVWGASRPTAGEPPQNVGSIGRVHLHARAFDSVNAWRSDRRCARRTTEDRSVARPELSKASKTYWTPAVTISATRPALARGCTHVGARALRPRFYTGQGGNRGQRQTTGRES